MNSEELIAFNNAKQALINYVTVGAVLHQDYKDIKQPLASFSIKLNIVQRKYSAFSRELLAIYVSVRHFRHLLGSRGFIIFTDHKPLIYALHSKPDKYNPRDIRQLDYIAQFTSDIQHIQGNDNMLQIHFPESPRT